jgi:hypothetical protein
LSDFGQGVFLIPALSESSHLLSCYDDSFLILFFTRFPT